MREEQVFLDALDLTDPDDRTAFLDKACGNDTEFRRQVEDLLAAHFMAGAFLDEPVGKHLKAGPETPARDDTLNLNPPPTADVPGYEVLGILGHGGMGVVYRARQLKANRLVALKMLRAVEHASPQERLRFQIETEAVARLQHPNIAQLYDVGEARGQPFFSLEYCAGGTLTEQLKKKPPSARESAELIETLARAMHYAHLRGVVHRDLKPGNVLLTAGGRSLKITDFGMAKRIDDEAREVSKSGAILGTASYMAPEQAAGKVRDTGPAADVYALGALLYECLTRQPPFKGSTTLDTLHQVLNEEPVAPSQRVGVPRDLETICLKCLRKEPEKRYASAEALADDLRRFLAGEPVQARPIGRLERAVKWARRSPALAALLVVTLSALVSLAALTGSLVVKEREARKEADKAKKARDFLVRIFELSDTQDPGNTMTPRQILDDAERRIPQEFADQPELQAELLAAIEAVYAKMTENAPLAMVLETSGTVRLHSDRNSAQRAVPQMLLYAGDGLSLAEDAQLQLVILSDLHKERLRSGTEVTIRRKGCEPADAVRERDPDVLMTFVRLPKGTFYMGWGGGNSFNDKGKKTEITEDFEIAAHDVTQGQWQAIMGDNPSYFSRFGGGRKKVKDITDEELKLFPVESVSWDDAQEFIRKLNERNARRNYLYRLPTQSEWEYACRDGATTEEECSFHFYFDKPTNRVSTENANYDGTLPNFTQTVKVRENSLGRPTRVGLYPPNKRGLCDMHGNVYQWCADLYDPTKGSNRGFRGGSWNNFAEHARAGFRGGHGPRITNNFVGFRLVRVPVLPR